MAVLLILIHRTLNSLSDEALGEVSKAYRNMVRVRVAVFFKTSLRKWLSSLKHEDGMIMNEMITVQFVTHRIVEKSVKWN